MFPSGSTVDDLELKLLLKTVLGLNKLDLAALLQSLPRSELDDSDAQGRTALYWAAMRGDVLAVSLLLSHGADANKGNLAGSRPLDAAIISKQEACVWVLLNSEPAIEVNYVESGNWTVLHECCRHGTAVDIVEYLLSRGVDIEGHVWNDTSALMLATARRHEHLVRCLISHGANMNSGDQHNNTSLHYAVEFQHSHALQLLLEHGANHTAKTNTGETLLHFAAEYGDLECLKILRTFDLNGINVLDRVTGVRPDQTSKGLIGLSALQIAEQREDVTSEWMDLFRQIIRGVEDPESRSRTHDLESGLDHFEDALEHQDDSEPR